jgi:cytidine deaminase
MKTTANLVIQAQKAMQNAYAPYSKFHVGAAIIDENNRLHTGCNVENSAYPLGTCAEASAISSMVLSGGRLIKQIMLVSSGEFMVTPCGGCRQKIKEFCDDETEILIAHNDTNTTFNIEDLLPHSFCKKHLNK